MIIIIFVYYNQQIGGSMNDLFMELETPGDVRRKVGELIKLMRNSRKISQQELAKNLNLNRQTIQKIESGKNFNIDTLLLIFKHFELLETFADFIKDQGTNFDEIDSLY